MWRLWAHPILATPSPLERTTTVLVSLTHMGFPWSPIWAASVLLVAAVTRGPGGCPSPWSTRSVSSIIVGTAAIGTSTLTAITTICPLSWNRLWSCSWHAGVSWSRVPSLNSATTVDAPVHLNSLRHRWFRIRLRSHWVPALFPVVLHWWGKSSAMTSNNGRRTWWVTT